MSAQGIKLKYDELEAAKKTEAAMLDPESAGLVTSKDYAPKELISDTFVKKFDKIERKI